MTRKQIAILFVLTTANIGLFVFGAIIYKLEFLVVPLPTLEESQPPTAKLISSETLDRKNPLSILKHIHAAFETGNVYIFDNLAYAQVGYGLYATDGGGRVSKDRFLRDLGLRLPNHPTCKTYNYTLGEIITLWVFTTNWEPEWGAKGGSGKPKSLALASPDQWAKSSARYLTSDLGGGNGKSKSLALEFSDQWTKDSGLYLIGAFRAAPKTVPGALACP